jgi:IS5 family transposase
MKPRKSGKTPQDQLFRVRLIDIVNEDHELVRLAKVIDWQSLDGAVANHFAVAGAPALPSRLVLGLMYLQHLHKLSDEAVLYRFVESPYYQYFCGCEFFEHNVPFHPTSLIKWRKRIGEAGCEELLAATIDAALKLKVITPSSLQRVVVDSTVQEKNIAHPTDSKLYEKARRQLVVIAHRHGIVLRQTYDKDCRYLAPQIGRYAHAKQFKRMRKALKKLKGCLGRVYRDLDRQIKAQSIQLTEKEHHVFELAGRLLKQEVRSKNKIYSLHEPMVDCISKGKAHKRYEFGCKVSIATTAKEAFIVGARSYNGAPYDGHTLDDQLNQVFALTNTQPSVCYVDRGYRGHGVESTRVVIAGQKRGLTRLDKRLLKRRNSVEPIIGHLKAEGKLGRCYLKGIQGDALNAILSACGQNLRRLLRWLYFAPKKWAETMLRRIIRLLTVADSDDGFEHHAALSY